MEKFKDLAGGKKGSADQKKLNGHKHVMSKIYLFVLVVQYFFREKHPLSSHLTSD